MIIYLMRHGDTDLSDKKVYYGHTDVPLNSAGIKRCEDIKPQITIKPDVVYTSDLLRARQTAEIVFGGGVSSGSLREINFGEWETLSYRDIVKKYPDLARSWASEDWFRFKFPGGESPAEMFERVTSFVNEIIDKNEYECVAITTHLGVIRTILTHLINGSHNNYWDYSSSLCGTTTVQITAEKCCIIK